MYSTFNCLFNLCGKNILHLIILDRGGMARLEWRFFSAEFLLCEF